MAETSTFDKHLFLFLYLRQSLKHLKNIWMVHKLLDSLIFRCFSLGLPSRDSCHHDFFLPRLFLVCMPPTFEINTRIQILSQYVLMGSCPFPSLLFNWQGFTVFQFPRLTWNSWAEAIPVSQPLKYIAGATGAYHCTWLLSLSLFLNAHTIPIKIGENYRNFISHVNSLFLQLPKIWSVFCKYCSVRFFLSVLNVIYLNL